MAGSTLNDGSSLVNIHKQQVAIKVASVFCRVLKLIGSPPLIFLIFVSFNLSVCFNTNTNTNTY